MDFEPLNDDHAIEEVIFSCQLARRIIPPDLRRAASNFQRFSADLPAVTLENDTALFAYLRPDGSATWAVHFSESAIAVSCTRYSRWQKVWSTAAAYLKLGLESLIEPEKTNLLALGLLVSDKFRGNAGTEPSTGALLRSNELIAAAAFSTTGLWHSHFGWFDNQLNNNPILNQLNVDRITEDAGNVQIPSIVIRHVQQLRPNPLPSVASLLADNAGTLASGMEYMHLQNKKILGNILVSEMQSRITLVVPK